MPAYSDMPSNYTVDEEAKSVAVKTLGYEKMRVKCHVGSNSRW